MKHHSPDCPPTSYQIDRCECGFIAQFILAPNSKEAHLYGFLPYKTLQNVEPIVLVDINAIIADALKRLQSIYIGNI